MSNTSSKHYDNSFMTSFSSLEDPRRTSKGNYAYPLVEILFLCICAILCGKHTNEEIANWGELEINWLRKFFPYENGTPSHDTIGKLFQKLDPKRFNLCFIDWVKTLEKLTGSQVISIDGKTIKGSAKAKKNAIHVVSAFASKNSLCLGQITVDQKSNEIKAIPELLELIAIKGMIITTDAMGCQTKIAEIIVEEEGDYVLQVKGNQEKLLEEITVLFNTDILDDTHLMEDAGHGRIETRICEVITDFEHVPCLEKWPNLKSLIRITSQIEHKASSKETVETRYYISSLNTNAERLNNIVRSHWSIENNLHWSLDVIFNEDKQQRKIDNSAANMNIINKMALNMLASDSTLKESKPLKRMRADKNTDFREILLGIKKG